MFSFTYYFFVGNYHSEYLERFLPVVLKLLQVVLGAAASVAHPAEPVGEELADVGDPVVVEPVHHPLDHLPCLLRLAHVRVPGQHGLLWAASFCHLRVLRSLEAEVFEAWSLLLG